MARAARLSWITTLVLAALGFAAWGSLALFYQAPLGATIRWPLAAGWTVLMALILALLPRLPLPRSTGLLAFCVAGLLVWWNSIVPRNDRDWSDDVSRGAVARIEGHRLVVENVRTFDWRSDEDYTPAWETRAYDLRSLVGVDLWSSTWAGEDIAHILVSFDFGPDAPPLAWSVELRREKGEVYSPLAGFFRTAELVAIAADERDIIRVRTTVRNETVRLYRLAFSPAAARSLLETYVAGANRLAARPQWYNTLTTNCTTTVFQIARTVEPGVPLDWRVLLSGHFAQYAYDHGALDRTMPFTALKDAARVNERALAADKTPQPEFSRRLRDGMPDPRSPR